MSRSPEPAQGANAQGFIIKKRKNRLDVPDGF
jgi:hypothetical protein